MADNRKHKRSTFTREVIFTVEGIDYHGFIENLSAEGVFIKTDESISVGKEVVLMFSVSDKINQLKFYGKIIWNGDDGIGVKMFGSSV